ncbi:MAG: 16S rRNA (cytosine(1402)-N(4))-methyltransferase RsmH [Candidatus Zixiibacteriota bacterium]|nr:MAG: 16S rRNA (cytosine(1402)-N(4))-methyltransferase RsmH [candidate division Zixibacteria bacterium]
MVAEVVELLITNPQGTYLDLTAGGGGHLKSLARRLGPRARLFGLDWDPDAVDRTRRALRGIVQPYNIVQAAFGDLGTVAARFEDERFDGILLDLGLSSYQLESPERGFSFRHDGPLDMRFDPTRGRPAWELIGSLDEKQLARLIREFGEEKQANRIARAIVMERQKVSIRTTTQLADIVLGAVRSPQKNKLLARVFQAFRIAVNQELEQLARVLPAALHLLVPGGRLAVISYHSLEDRQVKRFLQAESRGRCSCPVELAVCVCGAVERVIVLTPRPLAPKSEEIEQNPRARSARLRVGEKL